MTPPLQSLLKKQKYKIKLNYNEHVVKSKNPPLTPPKKTQHIKQKNPKNTETEWAV